VHDLTLGAFPFLTSLAASESPRDRRIWLRVASDHFVASQASDPEAIERFAEAMAPRLNTADALTRLEIARKLAPCAQTPRKLLALFESFDSETGDYVLQHAVAYDHAALKQAVGRSMRHAVAVAKRERLSPSLISVLAKHNEAEVVAALAANDSARLDGSTLGLLLRRARDEAEQSGDRRLVDALLGRRPMRPENATLFLSATPDQRVEILLAAQRAQLGRPAGPIFAAERERLHELELAAVARQPDRFVAILAEALNCDLDLARRIVDDPSGEPLAAALAALGAANEIVVRVLISTDLSAGASYRRIRALARLNNALNRNAAMLVIAALRGETSARRRSQSPAEAGFSETSRTRASHPVSRTATVIDSQLRARAR
jgi:uncharacterized protein (DUF2336 family)